MTAQLLPFSAIAALLVISPFAGAQSSVTTTETSAAGVPAATTTSSTTTTSVGTISQFGSDALTIQTTTDPAPIRYSFSQSTSYVDETGVPVAREMIKAGVPVTVHYVREGDRMIASRVVVRKTATATTTGPTVIERNTTVTKPPVIVEKPVVVEKPVIVEKKVPVVVEKTVEKPVIVEKPVVVEKRTKPAPTVVEEKTTTTTTTSKK